MAEIWKAPRWSPRGWFLYLLPLPLIPASMIALLRGNVPILLAEIGAMALLFGGAWLVRQGLKREFAERPRFTRTLPLKSLGYLATAAGVFGVSSMLVGQSILFATIVAALAGLGCFLSYGTDAPAQRLVVAAGSDYTAAEASAMLEEASKRIEGLERAAARIRDGEITTRLRHIADLARAILATLAQDPRDLRRARKFLNIYLDSAMRVSESYARTHTQTANAELESRFRNVLVTIEQVFGEQQQKLLENDVLDLDVQIEVLKTQLEREGVS